MKLADVNAIAGVLASLKVNRITDRAVKDEINESYLAVRKALRPFERDRDDLVEKFRSDWKDEIAATLAKKDFDRTNYLVAQTDLKITIEKMLNEGEAEIAFTPVDAEPLYAPDLWGDDYTLGQIANSVAFLVKHGVAKEE